MKVFDIFARFGRRSKALSVAVILGFEIQGLGHALGWRLIGSRYCLHPKPETPNLLSLLYGHQPFGIQSLKFPLIQCLTSEYEVGRNQKGFRV